METWHKEELWKSLEWILLLCKSLESSRTLGSMENISLALIMRAAECPVCQPEPPSLCRCHVGWQMPWCPAHHPLYWPPQSVLAPANFQKLHLIFQCFFWAPGLIYMPLWWGGNAIELTFSMYGFQPRCRWINVPSPPECQTCMSTLLLELSFQRGPELIIPFGSWPEWAKVLVLSSATLFPFRFF